MMLIKRDVARQFAAHVNTIDNYRRHDVTFPAPHRLSARTLRWDADAVEGWLAARCVTAGEPGVRSNAAKGAAERLGP